MISDVAAISPGGSDDYLAGRTFLVTGGAGFIGSALVRRLVTSTRATVVTVDALTYAGHLSTLESVNGNPRHHFVRADICDASVIAEVFARFTPDFVMHLAAESHVDRSIVDPLSFVRTNVLGTTVLLDAATQYYRHLQSTGSEKAGGFRLLHVSTDEVYGDLADASGAFNESSRYEPNSPYSASKAGADHLVRAWSRTYGLPVLISNSSNNYGPYQHPEKLIPKTILNVLSGAEIPIYGDGQQSRDWLFVDDHVSALVAVATRGDVGGTYTIAGGQERTNIGVVESICAILSELRPGTIGDRSDLIRFVEDRPGHDRRYALDVSKLRSELGWAPRQSFATGLRRTVEWYLRLGDGWLSRAVETGPADGTASRTRDPWKGSCGA